MTGVESNVLGRRAAWLAGVALVCASPAFAQPSGQVGSLPADAAHASAQQPAGEQTAPDLVYPSLHITGFADVDFASQSRSAGPRGFSLGQFVLHFASALSPRVNFFGELSFTPRADAGTGDPAAPGFNAEVERAIIRFDRSDRLKVSFGRYHTPVNWWNTAFHHGQWLQTTISRPEMTQFGGRFIPVHFVGALVQGSVPAHGWNLTYEAGVGNGRGGVISRAGDAGDANNRPAWVLNAFVKPARLFGLQAGGSVYLDRVSTPGQRVYDERIVAAHALWLREDPELIFEIAHVRHAAAGDPAATTNLAYYVQAAYRLPGAGRLWKPYYRFEHVDVDRADPVFAGVPDLDASTIGVRYDASTYAAIKSELRTRRRAAGGPRANGWFLQVAFTF